MLGSDDYTLADSYTLAGDLTFERSNPDSVWRCFDSGRENARQIRHSISAPMWMRLNLAYLRLQRLELEDIWRISPETFYADTVAHIDTFTGVAAATMYRSEGWRFMQLGRFIERAQLVIALLQSQLTAAKQSDESTDADWTSLLRLYHAFEVYNRRYSVAVEARDVLDLLVTDPRLPDSLCRSIDGAAEELAAIGPGPDARSSAAARRLAGQLGAIIHDQWPDQHDRHSLLEQVRVHCYELHDCVTAAYFDYPVEDAPYTDPMGGPASYDVEHVTCYRYSLPVSGCVMSLCLKPRHDAGQRLLRFEIETDPPAPVNDEEDGFGNTKHVLNIHREHRALTITARATVERMPVDPLPDSLSDGAWTEIRRWQDSFTHWDFTHPSELTQSSPAPDGFCVPAWNRAKRRSIAGPTAVVERALPQLRIRAG